MTPKQVNDFLCQPFIWCPYCGIEAVKFEMTHTQPTTEDGSTIFTCKWSCDGCKNYIKVTIE